MTNPQLSMLGDVCTITMGQAPKGSTYNEQGEGVPLVAGASDFGSIQPQPKKWTTAPTRVSEPGDIILCIRATIGDRNWSNREYCLGRGVAGLRANPTDLDQKYLWHWLSASANELKAKGRGATFLQVSRADIATMLIPLPRIEEQKRIAAILDAADALRAKRRETLAQLDTLLQSTFLEMFGDPVTNPKDWLVCAFDETGSFFSGSTPSKERKDFWNGSIPWVSPKDMKVPEIDDSIDHVSELAFTESNLKLLDPGHILIVVRGMILAHSFPVSINRVPVAINQDMKAIRPVDQLNPVYLRECIKNLKRKILAEISTAGHGTKRFDSNGMKRVLVPIPPDSLQSQFATIVQSVEQQKSRLRAHLAELDTLFASLQARAFAGEL